MKTIIIGAQGMLGQELVKVFENYQPICWGRAEIDISNREDVNKKISEAKPKLVINSAAYTDVDGAETDRDLAMEVNGYGVGSLAEACKKVGSILIHYSTDYVFDGKKTEGYKEDDQPKNPINVYGESKLLGEQLLQKNTDKYYLIRTSWLFGKSGKNFVETMLTLSEKNEIIKVVDDQYGKPTFAVDLAKKTKDLVEKKLPFDVYHITNEGSCTWYGFAKEIFKIVQTQKTKWRHFAFKEIKIKPVFSEEFPTAAKRPVWSILINTKLPPSRPWQEALREYLKN